MDRLQIILGTLFLQLPIAVLALGFLHLIQAVRALDTTEEMAAIRQHISYLWSWMIVAIKGDPNAAQSLIDESDD